MLVFRAIFTLALYVLFAWASVSPAAAQPASGAVPLSLEQVLKLSQAGVSEDLIIATIKKNGKPFDLSPDEILELRKRGVSDTVIEFLLDPTRPDTPSGPKSVAPAPTAAKPVPAKRYPPDANASRVPADPGLYSFPQGSLIQIEIKKLLGEKEGGIVLLKKSKSIAYLLGPAAKARFPEGAPVFYLRLPEGKIEEVLLVAMDRKSDRRELDPGPPGPKPEIKPEALRQFDSLEVGPGLYRLTPAKLAKGEYLLYLTGTAEPAKGDYGKGYDFGADAPIGEKH